MPGARESIAGDRSLRERELNLCTRARELRHLRATGRAVDERRRATQTEEGLLEVSSDSLGAQCGRGRLTRILAVDGCARSRARRSGLTQDGRLVEHCFQGRHGKGRLARGHRLVAALAYLHAMQARSDFVELEALFGRCNCDVAHRPLDRVEGRRSAARRGLVNDETRESKYDLYSLQRRLSKLFLRQLLLEREQVFLELFNLGADSLVTKRGRQPALPRDDPRPEPTSTWWRILR